MLVQSGRSRDFQLQEAGHLLDQQPLIESDFKPVYIDLTGMRDVDSDAFEEKIDKAAADDRARVPLKKKLVDGYAVRDAKEMNQSLTRWALSNDVRSDGTVQPRDVPPGKMLYLWCIPGMVNNSYAPDAQRHKQERELFFFYQLMLTRPWHGRPFWPEVPSFDTAKPQPDGFYEAAFMECVLCLSVTPFPAAF
jgi:hypothetical protein